jgi:hypothetical protein
MVEPGQQQARVVAVVLALLVRTVLPAVMAVLVLPHQSQEHQLHAAAVVVVQSVSAAQAAAATEVLVLRQPLGQPIPAAAAAEPTGRAVSAATAAAES